MEQKETCLTAFPVASPLSAYYREEDIYDPGDEDYAESQVSSNVDQDRVHVTIAWAVPVEAQLIGAQLEAYGESRATIYVFGKCIQSVHACQALANTPPEMVGMIARHIQALLFEERVAWWEDFYFHFHF